MYNNYSKQLLCQHASNTLHIQEPVVDLVTQSAVQVVSVLEVPQLVSVMRSAVLVMTAVGILIPHVRPGPLPAVLQDTIFAVLILSVLVSRMEPLATVIKDVEFLETVVMTLTQLVHVRFDVGFRTSYI